MLLGIAVIPIIVMLVEYDVSIESVLIDEMVVIAQWYLVAVINFVGATV